MLLSIPIVLTYLSLSRANEIVIQKDDALVNKTLNHLRMKDICSRIPDQKKFDCLPVHDRSASEEECKNRDCCWVPASSFGVPYCFYPTNFVDYEYKNITSTSTGLTAFLQRSSKSPYPDDIPLLQMNIHYETENRLHIQVSTYPKSIK